MINKKFLNKEELLWKQIKLEQDQFPCKCGHFKNSHIKGLCVTCHSEYFMITNRNVSSCFHEYVQMFNLDIIEWMAKHIQK